MPLNPQMQDDAGWEGLKEPHILARITELTAPLHPCVMGVSPIVHLRDGSWRRDWPNCDGHGMRCMLDPAGQLHVMNLSLRGASPHRVGHVLGVDSKGNCFFAFPDFPRYDGVFYLLVIRMSA